MERFILQPSQKKGFWVATDQENGIVVLFEEHKFNETQKVTLLDGDKYKSAAEATKLATSLRELGDWLRANHYNRAMPQVSIRLIVGNRIKELRVHKKLTQQELAQIAGITTANLCNIEAGKYSVGIDVLNRICEALNVEIHIY